MKDIMIKIKCRCGSCENGIVENPEWRAFREARPEVFQVGCPFEEFEAAAYEFSEGLIGEPEEVPCDECNWTGWVENWCDAYEVARELRRLAQTDEEYFRTT